MDNLDLKKRLRTILPGLRRSRRSLLDAFLLFVALCGFYVFFVFFVDFLRVFDVVFYIANVGVRADVVDNVVLFVKQGFRRIADDYFVFDFVHTYPPPTFLS